MTAVHIVAAGVVSPAGTTVESFWAGLCAARSWASSIDAQVAGLDLIGHVVPDDGWSDVFTHSERRRLDRFALLGMAAMQQAVTAVEAAWREVAPERRSISAGVGLLGIGTLTAQHAILRDEGWRKMSPFGVSSVMASSLVAYGAMRFDVRGEASTVTSACASGTQAIAAGARQILDGTADLVLAGGSEAPLDQLPMAAFARMEAMSRRIDEPEAASRPFDRDRDGFVLGEGAAFLLLANDEVARTLPILGTIDGWAVTTDAHHIAAPALAGDGAVRCMTGALRRAGLSPDVITHVNAHGTGTTLNDSTEAAALATVFGPRSVPVTSCKGAIGHLMGAAGAVEAVACLLAAREGTVPPTVNCDELDEGMAIDVVTGGCRTVPRAALSCSFGFGGQNAAIVVSPGDLQ